jgi:hypothetical protein
MEQRRLTKKEIVDLMVAQATFGRFKGDKRDGETPPITIQNFPDQKSRYAAKALRARLSRLPLLELATEALAALDYEEARQRDLLRIGKEADRIEREEAAQAFRQRQAEIARGARLQTTILAAARYYRQTAKKSAKEAWLAIKRNPYETDDGSIVVIETAKGGKEEMLVRSRQGKQKRDGIAFGTWQERYWPKAEHAN